MDPGEEGGDPEGTVSWKKKGPRMRLVMAIVLYHYLRQREALGRPCRQKDLAYLPELIREGDHLLRVQYRVQTPQQNTGWSHGIGVTANRTSRWESHRKRWGGR